MQHEFDRCRQLVDKHLETYFMEELPQKKLTEAMRYSLLAGGKRIRPVLVMQFCKAAGGNMNAALPFAAALEMLHTYSLIHDDLPCMDDDDLRRGKPTNHKVYGECLATLAGDALQAAAFETLLSAELPAEKVVRAGQILAAAAGEKGICGGQTLDMESEGKEIGLGEMTSIHGLKTASMIMAASQLGVIAACGSEDQIKAAEDYAAALGLAFQIRDDILDDISTSQKLGKPVGSDQKSSKSTFVSLMGLEASEILVRKNTEKAKEALSGKFKNTNFLYWLADMLAERDY